MVSEREHLYTKTTEVSQRRKRSFLSRHGSDLFLVSPALLILVIFVLLPILSLLPISLTNWSIIGQPEWVGLRNFQRLLNDSVFLKTIKNTLTYTVILVPTITAAALGVALILDTNLRAMNLLKALFLIPLIAGIVITSNIWKGLLTTFGPVNQSLGWFGIDPVNFFGVNTAVITVSATLIWRNFGYYALFYLAGLRSIDPAIKDAAAIDGAQGWTMFRHIIWPLLLPVTLLVVILNTIGSFEIFTAVYILTAGGPANASLPILNYIYDTGWRNFQMGYAAAQALVFFVILFALSAVQRKLIRGEHA
jgi:multiple sugar transport system permease protein